MSKQEAEKNSISFEFEDNLALINLFGQYDENLLLIEKMNDVSISRIGNKVKIKGDKKSIIDTHQILNNLYHKIKNGEEIDDEKIKDAKSVIIFNNGEAIDQKDLFIETRKKKIYARTENQKNYFKALNDKDIIFVVVPSGTG